MDTCKLEPGAGHALMQVMRDKGGGGDRIQWAGKNLKRSSSQTKKA